MYLKSLIYWNTPNMDCQGESDSCVTPPDFDYCPDTTFIYDTLHLDYLVSYMNTQYIETDEVEYLKVRKMERKRTRTWHRKIFAEEFQLYSNKLTRYGKPYKITLGVYMNVPTIADFEQERYECLNKGKNKFIVQPDVIVCTKQIIGKTENKIVITTSLNNFLDSPLGNLLPESKKNELKNAYEFLKNYIRDERDNYIEDESKRLNTIRRRFESFAV